MSLKFGSSEVTSVIWNNTPVTKVIYNGTVVWEASTYPLSGTWIFAENINSYANDSSGILTSGSFSYDISFTSNDREYSSITCIAGSEGGVRYYNADNNQYLTYYLQGNTTGTWVEGEEYRIITFTEEQEVPKAFYDWFTYRARQFHSVSVGTDYLVTASTGYTDLKGSVTTRLNGAYSFQFTDITVDTEFVFADSDVYAYQDGNYYYIVLRTSLGDFEVASIYTTTAPTISKSTLSITGESVQRYSSTPSCTLVLDVDAYGDIEVVYVKNGVTKNITAPANETTTIEADCGSEITFTHTEGESIWFDIMTQWETVSNAGSVKTFKVPSESDTYTLRFDHA